ncbi:hypothetical protein BH11MYX4_BH11MYX4_44760 [soil metagenome]
MVDRPLDSRLLLPIIAQSKCGDRRNPNSLRWRVALRESVPHRRRPAHKGYNPVHVTLRGARGLPSFRCQRVNGLLNTILTRQRRRRYAGEFQVVEFSIQDNHLHLIVEATGANAPGALRAGVTGLMVSFAKRLNHLLKGKVWGDRWHGQELPRHGLLDTSATSR